MREIPEEDGTASPEISLHPGDWILLSGLALIFLLTVAGNACELLSIFRTMQRRISPMHKLLLHLSIADLLIAFTIFPSEVFGRIAAHWDADIHLCKALQFARSVGFNLSGVVLICLSVDRYYAVVHPLRSLHSQKRVRNLALAAWLAAILTASAQAVVFRMQTNHVSELIWKECLSLWEVMTVDGASTLLQLTLQFLIPLVVTITSYAAILYRIYLNPGLPVCTPDPQSLFLRRSGNSLTDRARLRTIKLTVIVVIAFILCWTPFAILAIWSLINVESVMQHVSPFALDCAFQLVLANSFIKPILYGIFVKTSSSRSCQSTSATNTIELHTINSVNLHGTREIFPKRNRSICAQ